MKVVATLSAMLGVVVGLLFGLLTWGGATGPQVQSAAGREADTELLDALRDLREAVDRQAQSARLAAGTVTATPEVQALSPTVPTVSADEFRAALDQAVRDLRDLTASAGGSLAMIEVSPDAEAQVAALCASVKVEQDVSEDLLLLTPRDIYRRFGRPAMMHGLGGGMSWTYRLWKQAKPVALRVEFAGGYVIAAKRSE